MSRIRLTSLFAVVAVSAALTITAPTTARPMQTKTRITVTLTDHSIGLSKKVVPHGELVFTIFNKGTRMHTFKISYKVTLGIRPGKTGRLVIVLPKGGYRCTSTLDSDVKHGMRAVLKLT